MLLHNAAQVGLPVDSTAVYDPPDMDFVLALEMTVDRLYATQEEARRQAPEAD